MFRILCYTMIGYLSGSILYAPFWARLLHRGDILTESEDHNPGTANAFVYGGFACGLLTLLCELLKGYLPVAFCLGREPGEVLHRLAFALVLAAPVIGHIYPVFRGFEGGKGIAVTFGCLIGLLPMRLPLEVMIVSFLFFSVVLQVNPHFYRTIVAYGCALVAMVLLRVENSVTLGFAIITAAVVFRLHRSTEERERIKVGLLWRS